MSFRSCVSSLATLVRVEVVAARKLPLRSADEEDFPSPYVIVDYVDKKKSTDVIQETISPRWRVGSSNKIFSLYATLPEPFFWGPFSSSPKKTKTNQKTKKKNSFFLPFKVE
jgi:hypothetical protein